ncbi:hypothetical protein G7Y89_g5429 [Cudoniella acicularis]|uniref:STAS domain-containing protein n=1 Tax=Cudoniella acicularis TaxID=354080 RepID=A0A8H4W3T3_9HELO|nr:hypothetical protein G7Y89_g5429 [Cudoniella acicularis]
MAPKLLEKLRNDPNLTRAGVGIARGAKGFPAGTGRYLARKLPVVQWLPNYSPGWLVNDIIAGISVGLVALPQAITFSMQADVPIKDALLGSWLPPIIYTLMGTSRDITPGLTATTTLFTGQVVKTIVTLAPAVPPVFIITMVSFAVGIWSLILGLLNLGFIFDLLSQPVVDGFIMGVSQIVVLGQIPAILGLVGISPVFMDQMPQILKSLNLIKASSIGLAVTGIVLMVALQFIGKKWGSKNRALKTFCTARHIIVIGIFTLVSFLVNKNLGTEPVWQITAQVDPVIPNPTIPNSILLQNLLLPAVAITLFVALEHISLAKSLANLKGYSFDPSQELVSLGITNTINSLIGGAPVGGVPLAASSPPLILLYSIFQLGSVLKWIPAPTLAAVILVSVVEAAPPMGLLGIYWKISFVDFLANILAFNTTLLVSGQVGIGMGFAISTFYTLFRLMSTRPTTLSSSDLENQHNPGHSSWWTKGDTVPDGTAVISIPRDLMYLNAKRIKKNILDSVYTDFYGIPPSDAEKRERNWNFCAEKYIARLRRLAGISRVETKRLRILILDLSAVSFVDATGMQALTAIKKEIRVYGGINVEMRFVGMKEGVKKRFKRAGWGLTSPYETELLDPEILEVVSVERDLVFDHLALAVQYQNSVGKGMRVNDAFNWFFPTRNGGVASNYIEYPQRTEIINEKLFISDPQRLLKPEIISLNMSSSSKSSSIYDNLPVDSSTIRILTLLPSSSPSSEIHFLLSTAKFLRSPKDAGTIKKIATPFEALSYTWGAKEPRYNLVCQGSKIDVNKNLHEALKALRYPTVERKLWVDAICINQADNNEKSTQVPLMKYIYQHAKRVMIWLGPEDNGTETAFRLIRLAAKCAHRELGVLSIPFFSRSANWLFYWLLGAIYYYFGWEPKTISHEEFSAEANKARGFPSMEIQKDIDEWVALAGILKREWFSRCWIKQESAFASVAKIQVGTHVLDWSDLCLAIRFFANKRYAQVFGPQTLKRLHPELQNLQTFEGFDEVIRNVYALCVYSRISMGRTAWHPMPLIALLDATRSLQASMEVDKVYAMLGLAKEESEITVDYDTSVRVLYTKVARLLLQTPPGQAQATYPLQALAHVKHYPESNDGKEKADNTEPDESLPSWVACWHDPRQQSDARKDNESPRMFLISDLKSSVKFTAGGTEYVPPVVDPLKPEDPYEISFEGFEFGTISTTSEPLKTLPLSRSRLWDLVTDIWKVVQNRHVLYPTGERIDEALAQTLTMSDTASLMASQGEDTYHAIDFQHFCGEYIRLKALVGEEHVKSLTFSRDLQRTCRSRKLFGTKERYIGVGDITLEKGDLVCVLLGGKTPFILRQVVGSKYRFIVQHDFFPLSAKIGLVDLEMRHSPQLPKVFSQMDVQRQGARFTAWELWLGEV